MQCVFFSSKVIYIVCTSLRQLSQSYFHSTEGIMISSIYSMASSYHHITISSAKQAIILHRYPIIFILSFQYHHTCHIRMIKTFLYPIPQLQHNSRHIGLSRHRKYNSQKPSKLQIDYRINNFQTFYTAQTPLKQKNNHSSTHINRHVVVCSAKHYIYISKNVSQKIHITIPKYKQNQIFDIRAQTDYTNLNKNHQSP